MTEVPLGLPISSQFPFLVGLGKIGILLVCCCHVVFTFFFVR